MFQCLVHLHLCCCGIRTWLENCVESTCPCLSDPTIRNSEKSLLQLFELPKDVMHTVIIEKLNQSLQHSSNWQQLAERLDITKEHVERFPGRNLSEQLLQYLQTKRPHITVREFAQVLQDTGHSDAVESLKAFASSKT